MSSAVKREARAVSTATSAGPAPRTAERFPLGWRLRPTVDGRCVRVPLTAADLLDPREGDSVTEGNWHYRVLDPIADLLRRVLERRGLAVFRDVLLTRKHHPNMSPDVAVISGLDSPTVDARGIRLDRQGVQLLFALEVVSNSRKEIREKDYVANVRIYAEAGVSEYLAVEPGDLERQTPVKLSAWRLEAADAKLRPVELDARGGFSSETIGLRFGPDPGSPRLAVEDAATGERLRVSDEEEATRRDAERRAAEAERRVAELERELARRE